MAGCCRTAAFGGAETSMPSRVLFYSSVASKKQFVSQEYYRTDIRILRNSGLDVRLSKHWYDFLAFWRYDIAFIYFYRFGLIPALIARLAGRRVFFSGGIDYLDRALATPKQYVVQALLYNLCSVLSSRNIIVSDADLRNCERVRTLFPARRQVVCKHAISDLYLVGGAGASRKDKLVITIAWMGRTENVVRKGLTEALDFFDEMRRRDPDWLMLVIGPKGEGSKLVEARIRELGLEGHVELTGRVSEQAKIALLTKAQVYLQLSQYEGFGIAAIEALACRCLVVHSGAGGLSEGVGRYGLHWTPDSAQATVERAFGLLGDCEQLRLWTERGREHVMAAYSIANRASAFSTFIR
jgi:glycosyltransferase involved in cell wall biosynthesis